MPGFDSQLEANKWLFNNQFLADVQFEFNDDQILYAHSLILATRSDVFHEQFKLCDSNVKVFCMPESKIEHYREFLKFIYTDDCDVTNDNYKFLWKIAINHDLNVLKNMCCNHYELQKKIESVAKKTLSVEYSIYTNSDTIAERFSEIIKSDELLTIDKETLETILKINSVDESNETEVFDAVMKWAEYACIQSNLSVTGANKRNVLGNLIKEIRFQYMTTDEFAACVAKHANVLTSEEITDLLVSISLKQFNKSRFSIKERNSLYDVSDVKENVLMILKDNQGELIKCPTTKAVFKVSHKILLTSCWIWAHSQDRISCKLSKEQEILYEYSKSSSPSAPLMSFYFDKKIVLSPDRKYTIEFSYENSNSTFWCRANSPATPFCENHGGVNFEFFEYGMNILRRLTFQQLKSIS